MKKGFGVALACLMLLGSFGAAAQTETYKIETLDVPYQEQAAEQLQGLGLMWGTENGFALEEAVTREQAATMVVRLMGENVQQSGTEFFQKSSFTDISGSWARNLIACATEKGYVKGVSETTFEPERGVTGQEFATMLLRAFGYAAEPDTAYEMGIAAGMLLNNYSKAAVEQADYALIRSDMANICNGALLAKTADGEPVRDMLIAKGKFTEEQWKTVMTQDETLKNTGFTWKLNAQMPQDENYMFSPFSIKMAFAMAANGAAGETRQEILDALDIEDLDAFNKQAAQVMETYNARDELKLQVANSIWRNTDNMQGRSFAPDYQKKISQFYQGTAADVTNQNAVDTVNSWVEEHTNGKIDSIIQKSEFWTLLVNAVYFKGTWANQFSEGATRPDTFVSRDGKETEIDFMHETGYMDYYADENMQMVRLPYKGADISMYIALTDQPNGNLEQAAEHMSRSYVALSLPKFRTEFSTDLNDMMKNLGVQTAFESTAADFSPMIGERLLFINSVLHKTYIDVDENGTEAAAVTAIAAVGGSAFTERPEPIAFKADHPFTYFIRDDAAGEILFLGQYAFAQ